MYARFYLAFSKHLRISDKGSSPLLTNDADTVARKLTFYARGDDSSGYKITIS